MEKAQILKMIGAIGKASAKLTRDIQSAAVECAMHALAHGDVTLADQLVDALGKGLRKASLRAWFERHTWMLIPTGKQTFALDKDRAKSARKSPEAEVRARLADLPWEEAKPEAPVVSVFDVSQAVDKFLDRIQKQINMEGVSVRNRALFDAINAANSQWQNAEVLKSAKVEEPAQLKKVA